MGPTTGPRVPANINDFRLFASARLNGFPHVEVADAPGLRRAAVLLCVVAAPGELRSAERWELPGNSGSPTGPQNSGYSAQLDNLGDRGSSQSPAAVVGGTRSGALGASERLGGSDGPLSVIVIKRAYRGRNAGQWGLPGGRLDDGETPEQAALRELHEELGLTAGPADLLGRLDDFPATSGFVITPLVAVLSDISALRPSPAEVHSVHLVPLDRLAAEDVPHWVHPHEAVPRSALPQANTLPGSESLGDSPLPGGLGSLPAADSARVMDSSGGSNSLPATVIRGPDSLHDTGAGTPVDPGAPSDVDSLAVSESVRILQMRLGERMTIHAPTGALLWQFREIVLLGRDPAAARVSHFAQPGWTRH